MADQQASGGWSDDDVIIGYPSDRVRLTPSVVGAEARLRSGTVIYEGSRIGARFSTGHHVLIREENVIGDDVSVWTNSVIDYGCHIGNGVKIHCNCYIAQYTVIEDDAFLAPGVTIANDLYPRVAGSRSYMTGPRIGTGARIGANVTILPFVRIGAAVLIGAGSVVTRDIPAGAVAYGAPARLHGRVADLVALDDRVVADEEDESRYRLAVIPGDGSS